MANLRDIKKRYKTQLDQAKENYKQEKGLKIARGFNSSPAAKKIARNERQAIYRRDRKIKLDRVKTVVTQPKIKNDNSRRKVKVQSFEDGFTNTKVWEEGAPFYNVLSYGSKADNAAVHFFKKGKGRMGKDFFAVIDKRDMGGDLRTYTSLAQYQIAIQELYGESTERQSTFDMDSDGINVSVVEGDYNNNTYLYVNVSSRL